MVAAHAGLADAVGIVGIIFVIGIALYLWSRPRD